MMQEMESLFGHGTLFQGSQLTMDSTHGLVKKRKRQEPPMRGLQYLQTRQMTWYLFLHHAQAPITMAVKERVITFMLILLLPSRHQPVKLHGIFKQFITTYGIMILPHSLYYLTSTQMVKKFLL